MQFLRRVFRRIEALESARSFFDNIGLLRWIGLVVPLLGAAVLSVWAWLESHLPLWVIAILFVVLIVLALHGMNLVVSMYLKIKQANAIDRLVVIDRDVLADEIEEISRKIAGLVGEYRGPMQEAWAKDRLNSDPTSWRQTGDKVEGQLTEKFSYRYAADVWRLIRRASKVVYIDRSDLWSLEHGVRGESGLMNLYVFLAKLSDDVRSPKQPLITNEVPVSQSLLAPGSETRP